MSINAMRLNCRAELNEYLPCGSGVEHGLFCVWRMMLSLKGSLSCVSRDSSSAQLWYNKMNNKNGDSPVKLDGTIGQNNGRSRKYGSNIGRGVACFICVGLTSALLLNLPRSAMAETLASALASAYANNPGINAQRALTRSNDENIPLSTASFLPSISINSTLSRNLNKNFAAGTKNQFGNRAEVDLRINQNLFNGFQSYNSLRAAEAASSADHADLGSKEQQLLFNVVKAYANVIKQQKIYRYNLQNISSLREQVKSARDKLNVGEGTRTDVLAAESSLSKAQASLQIVAANLTQARMTYLRYVGRLPKDLQPIDIPRRLLPGSESQGIAIAMRNHPGIVAATNQLKAAGYKIKQTKGSFLPTLDLSASAGRGWQNGNMYNARQPGATQKSNTAAIGLTLTIPIYSGGQRFARVRQEKQKYNYNLLMLKEQKSTVRSDVVASWYVFQSLRAQILANQAAVKSALSARDGIIEEQRVGERTTLDVLNSETAVINAQIDLAEAQYNRAVSAFQLLAAMGKLDVKSLGLRVKKYNPDKYRQKVRYKMFGTGIN